MDRILYTNRSTFKELLAIDWKFDERLLVDAVLLVDDDIMPRGEFYIVNPKDLHYGMFTGKKDTEIFGIDFGSGNDRTTYTSMLRIDGSWRII